MKVKSETIKKVLFNLPGWHTKKKIIVFESDDWGSIRTPSKEAYDYLIKKGYPIDRSPYGKDSLESNEDLTCLMEILSSLKNNLGQNPVFTLNNIVANPDFEKIKQSGFKEYHYEIFADTYKRYPFHSRSLDLIKEGLGRKIFKPQLHGREHLNIRRWLNSLQTGQVEALDCFKKYMIGLPFSAFRTGRSDFQRTFDYETSEDLNNSCSIISDACKIFKTVWGYNSITFIAPNFFWDDNIEDCLIKNGVKVLQGQRAQYLTNMNGTYKAKYHFTGQKNKLDQIYFIRNCYFEPSFDKKKDWVGSCLREISMAFTFRKPAIISTHRVNYIGSIDESNRTRNILALKQLLRDIVKQWPDVEFMSSNQLGELILSSKTTDTKSI